MRITATDSHEAFRQEFVELLRKHTGHLSAIETLAAASQAVGQIIAMQNQRKFTKIDLMDTVFKNIEIGNEAMVEFVKSTKGSA